MRILKIYFCILAMLATSALFAQNITVKGSVTDSGTGEPIPFASIQVQGTSTGTSTDENGMYVISTPPPCHFVSQLCWV